MTIAAPVVHAAPAIDEVITAHAEAVASKPGSFATAFIDALDAVDETSLRSRRKSARPFSSGNIEAEIPPIALRAVKLKFERAERCLLFTRSNR